MFWPAPINPDLLSKDAKEKIARLKLISDKLDNADADFIDYRNKYLNGLEKRTMRTGVLSSGQTKNVEIYPGARHHGGGFQLDATARVNFKLPAGIKRLVQAYMKEERPDVRQKLSDEIDSKISELIQERFTARGDIRHVYPTWYPTSMSCDATIQYRFKRVPKKLQEMSQEVNDLTEKRRKMEKEIYSY